MSDIHVTESTSQRKRQRFLSSPIHTVMMTLRSIFYHPTTRNVFFQLLLISLLSYFIATIVGNTLENLHTRGITTGFDFLTQEAGFGIGFTLIDYDETHTYAKTFLVGLLNTCLVSLLGIFFATVLGFLLGIARLSTHFLLNRLALIYIEIFRNIPLLLQILFWYFAVLQALPSPRNSLQLGDSLFINVRGLSIISPIFDAGSEWFVIVGSIGLIIAFIYRSYAKRQQTLTGKQSPITRVMLAIIVIPQVITYFLLDHPIQWEKPQLTGFNFEGGITVIPELAALLLALSIYTAAFIAEIVRSGIQAVDSGQKEAASALGLSKSHQLRLIVIPQALRVIIPPLTSQYLNLTKNSSLAMAIGYPDLVSVFAGTTLNQTGQAIEIIAMTMAVYLTLSLITSMIMNYYNHRVALMER